jgi:hypothetical protein
VTDDVGRGVQSMSMKRFEESFRFILGDLEGICKECVRTSRGGGFNELRESRD